MRRPRILLVDDRILRMDAFRKLLEPEFEIVGTVSDGRALLHVASHLLPDLIVIDVGMPLLNGPEIGRKLKDLVPRTRLLMVTMNEGVGIAVEALREWAAGFLLKNSAGPELTYALRELIGAKPYITPRVANHKQRRELFQNASAPSGEKLLTARQREVLQLLAEGLTMKAAAETLSLTPRTVAFHKYKIMQDFNLRSNVELLKLAIRENLVPPE
ncbi:response regulator transcription factor [Alloacidobacterium sp.]|uniref:response regulator transcription factor n=1 Tax=Alloacidobacterium sp. TaxID=2951999 RepID=UPI002D6A7814|nr:response regulator transcription factor [Alloacidobacterium sp.]HYK36939.1 response regulator transcription factor [Alloacidobacterium sp.]